jgi:hypothetical protein
MRVPFSTQPLQHLLLVVFLMIALLPNHLAWLLQSFCLNTNIRIGCWRSNTRTQARTEILWFQNLEYFCLFACSIVSSVSCFCVFVHLPMLIFWGLFCCY